MIAAEERALQEEADRQQRIRDSFNAQMPDEISQKVQAALQKEMVSPQSNMQYDSTHANSRLACPHVNDHMFLFAAGTAATGHVSSVCKTRG